MPGWVTGVLVAVALLALGLAAVTVVGRLNEPSPFVLSASDPPRRLITVEVEGAVAAPGVYQLPHGSRLGDLIALAGGLDGAEASAINDALLLLDGEQVRIPVAGSPEVSGSGLVDINSASMDELDTLPDVGPVRAEAIIASRETDGPYGSIEDLVLREVISLGLFEQIRHLITVSP